MKVSVSVKSEKIGNIYIATYYPLLLSTSRPNLGARRKKRNVSLLGDSEGRPTCQTVFEGQTLKLRTLRTQVPTPDRSPRRHPGEACNRRHSDSSEDLFRTERTSEIPTTPGNVTGEVRCTEVVDVECPPVPTRDEGRGECRGPHR